MQKKFKTCIKINYWLLDLLTTLSLIILTSLLHAGIDHSLLHLTFTCSIAHKLMFSKHSKLAKKNDTQPN
jgi:hypothetical protein